MDLCHCGRELRLLNDASDTAKCVGCGNYDELCRCTWFEQTAVEVPN